MTVHRVSFSIYYAYTLSENTFLFALFKSKKMFQSNVIKMPDKCKTEKENILRRLAGAQGLE